MFFDSRFLLFFHDMIAAADVITPSCRHVFTRFLPRERAGCAAVQARAR